MKFMISKGFSLFIKLVIVGLMSFFVCISLSVLSTAAFSKNIGYTAYGYLDTSDSSAENASSGNAENEQTELYKYYFDDGEDTKRAEYEAKGYKVTTSSIRSEVSSTGNTVFIFVTLLFSVMIMIAFIYPDLWHIGATDSNSVRFNRMEPQPYKGMKIGFIAAIPSFLLYVAFVVCALGVMPELPVVVYKFLNATFFTLYDVIFGKVATAGEISWWRLAIALIPLLSVPAVAGVAYLLGYKDVSLGEKFIYKKNKGR